MGGGQGQDKSGGWSKWDSGNLADWSDAAGGVGGVDGNW